MRASKAILWGALSLALYAAGCKTAPAQANPEPAASAAATKKLELKPAGAGDVATLMVAEAAKAKANGRKVLVYVGAPWCEPCQAFHQAAAKGELDRTFPDVTFIEFNADNDGERLAKAGYSSTYIPLFVIPEADGRASSKRVEGGIKGPNGNAYLTQKLRAIL